MYIITLNFHNESGDSWTETLKAEKKPTIKQLEWYTKSIAGGDIDGPDCYLYPPSMQCKKLESLDDFIPLKKDPKPNVDFI